MEAKLKDGSILYVDSEERIYAQGIPDGPFPLVIDQAEGERLLIEFAEEQQKKVEALETANDLLHDETKELQQEVKRLKKFYDYFRELYGQSLEIAFWHQNGELEPFDNFFESAEQEMD